ncbi:MAG: isoprenylcysteine carboxylmethyltransferase family protein [Acidobacteria bacterium]|nr:isoprenylcysteine carboxylmethyltransferase family protein [Acidobacteriota bacterium]MBV9438092.1 isoprenylcysteine carboxylmethyltransferase family protein [Acidobacteriota bacterium]
MSAIQLCRWLWTLLAVLWLVFAFRRKQTQERESGVSRLLYSIPTIIAFFLLFGARVPYQWLYLKVLPRSASMNALGVGLTAVGIGFAIWARIYIGENWSGTVTVKVDHELIRTGPYALVRHPIYSGLLLATLGTGIVRGQVRGLLAVPILWFGFWLKTRIEERFMRKTFGHQYDEYSRTTGALVPRLR